MKEKLYIRVALCSPKLNLNPPFCSSNIWCYSTSGRTQRYFHVQDLVAQENDRSVTVPLTATKHAKKKKEKKNVELPRIRYTKNQLYLLFNSFPFPVTATTLSKLWHFTPFLPFLFKIVIYLSPIKQLGRFGAWQTIISRVWPPYQSKTLSSLSSSKKIYYYYDYDYDDNDKEKTLSATS